MRPAGLCGEAIGWRDYCPVWVANFRRDRFSVFRTLPFCFTRCTGGAGRIFVHCANLQTLPTLAAEALEATRRLVMAGQVSSLSGTSLRAGRAEGLLWGGNLCVLASLCGTSEALQPGPKILFLEDVNEAPYRVDRLLTQLHECGAFEGLSGMALGKFTGCGDLRVLWEHWAKRWRVPVVCDLPFGHCEDNYPLLLGARACLDQNQISWVVKSMRSGSGAGSWSSS